MAIPKFKDREPAAACNTAVNTNTTAISTNQWSVKHEPQRIGEVAIHPAKLKEIEQATSPQSVTRVFVLSGPSGSSKSTAIRKLAEQRGQMVIEFHAPESSVGSTSLLQSFQDFLVGAAVFGRASTIVLVEEFPTLFHDETRQAFEASLIDWSQQPQQPVLALSFTEIETSAQYSDAVVVPRVLGRLIAAPLADVVVWQKTNPVNATTLQKTLKSILTKEKLSIPPPIVKSLAACGDVRSAINCLELFCRYGPGCEQWTRGSPVSLFHAIGKVVFGSSKPGSLEKSLAEFEDTLSTFNLTILENYTAAKHQQMTLETCARASEWLSLADLAPARTTLVEVGQLGALGAAHEIASGGIDSRAARTFLPLKFTQYPQFIAEYMLEHSKLTRLQRNARQTTNTMVSREAVLDDKSFGRFAQPEIELLEDSDEEF